MLPTTTYYCIAGAFLHCTHIKVILYKPIVTTTSVDVIQLLTTLAIEMDYFSRLLIFQIVYYDIQPNIKGSSTKSCYKARMPLYSKFSYIFLVTLEHK